MGVGVGVGGRGRYSLFLTVAAPQRYMRGLEWHGYYTLVLGGSIECVAVYVSWTGLVTRWSVASRLGF